MLDSTPADPFNPRASEAAALVAAVKPIRSEDAHALRDALRLVIGRVETGSPTVIMARELAVFRRLAGLSPTAPAIPSQWLPKQRIFRKSRDSVRLRERLKEGPMTVRQIMEHFEWTRNYSSQVAVRLAVTGQARRDVTLVAGKAGLERDGRPAYLYHYKEDDE